MYVMEVFLSIKNISMKLFYFYSFFSVKYESKAYSVSFSIFNLNLSCYIKNG